MTADESWDARSPEWSKRLAFVRRVLSSSQYELTAEDREELAQEALVDLFERARSERPRNPEGLLRTIAHRKAIDITRRAARRPVPMIAPPDTVTHEGAAGLCRFGTRTQAHTRAAVGLCRSGAACRKCMVGARTPGLACAV